MIRDRYGEKRNETGKQLTQPHPGRETAHRPLHYPPLECGKFVNGTAVKTKPNASSVDLGSVMNAKMSVDYDRSEERSCRERV